MYRHVNPNLKLINKSLSNCSLRDGTINFIKYASIILLLRVFSGFLVNTHQLNSCSVFLVKWFAGSEFLVTSLRSSYLILQFLIFSPKTRKQWHNRCWILSFDGINKWILRLFLTTLNLKFSLVKESNL